MLVFEELRTTNTNLIVGYSCYGPSHKLELVKCWVKDNTQYKVVMTQAGSWPEINFYFSNDYDMLAFKLKWL